MINNLFQNPCTEDLVYSVTVTVQTNIKESAKGGVYCLCLRGTAWGMALYTSCTHCTPSTDRMQHFTPLRDVVREDTLLGSCEHCTATLAYCNILYLGILATLAYCSTLCLGILATLAYCTAAPCAWEY